MSVYNILNEENNTQLCYGWDDSLGYYYSILDLNEEDSEKFILEQKSLAKDSLSEKDFYDILEEWEAPREHLLAVILNENF